MAPRRQLPVPPKDRGFDHVVWTKGGGVGSRLIIGGTCKQVCIVGSNDELVKMQDEDDGIEGSFSTNFFSQPSDGMDGGQSRGEEAVLCLHTNRDRARSISPSAGRSRGVDAKVGSIENIDKNMGGC